MLMYYNERRVRLKVHWKSNLPPPSLLPPSFLPSLPSPSFLPPYIPSYLLPTFLSFTVSFFPSLSLSPFIHQFLPPSLLPSLPSFLPYFLLYFFPSISQILNAYSIPDRHHSRLRGCNSEPYSLNGNEKALFASSRRNLGSTKVASLPHTSDPWPAQAASSERGLCLHFPTLHIPALEHLFPLTLPGVCPSMFLLLPGTCFTLFRRLKTIECGL